MDHRMLGPENALSAAIQAPDAPVPNFDETYEEARRLEAGRDWKATIEAVMQMYSTGQASPHTIVRSAH